MGIRLLVLGGDDVTRFSFHFNKPASRSRGYPVISLHFDDKCHMVRGLDCAVPTTSRIYKRSPQFVMAGRANAIRITRAGIAVIA